MSSKDSRFIIALADIGEEKKLMTLMSNPRNPEHLQEVQAEGRIRRSRRGRISL